MAEGRGSCGIGVFGGTFDPPHIGHLLLACDALESLRLERVTLVPSATQPLKADSPALASAADRLEMVTLATAGDARYAVEGAEIEREGLSYTVDTLELLSSGNPGAELFLLMGEDSLATFECWRSPGRIRELATIGVMSRGEGSVDGARRDGVLDVSTRRVDVSSTEIRARVRGGKSIRGFVPEAVEKFIQSRRLYR